MRSLLDTRVRAAAGASAVLALSVLTAPSARAVDAGEALDASRVGDEQITASVRDFELDPAVRDLIVESVSLDGAATDATTSTARTLTVGADVLFEFGEAELTSAATKRLRSLVTDLGDEADGATVTIEGYTDSVGPDATNLQLSQRRAEAVLAAVGPLLATATFEVFGRGEADPVAPNAKADGTDNPTGRAKNRRVTITIPR